MIKRFMDVVKDEEGAAMVEYALLVALIAVVVMVALGPLGDTIALKFGDVDSAIANVPVE